MKKLGLFSCSFLLVSTSLFGVFTPEKNKLIEASNELQMTPDTLTGFKVLLRDAHFNPRRLDFSEIENGTNEILMDNDCDNTPSSDTDDVIIVQNQTEVLSGSVQRAKKTKNRKVSIRGIDEANMLRGEQERKTNKPDRYEPSIKKTKRRPLTQAQKLVKQLSREALKAAHRNSAAETMIKKDTRKYKSL